MQILTPPSRIWRDTLLSTCTTQQFGVRNRIPLFVKFLQTYSLGEQIGGFPIIYYDSNSRPLYILRSRNAALGLGDGNDRIFPDCVALPKKDAPTFSSRTLEDRSTVKVREVKMSKLHTGKFLTTGSLS